MPAALTFQPRRWDLREDSQTSTTEEVAAPGVGPTHWAGRPTLRSGGTQGALGGGGQADAHHGGGGVRGARGGGGPKPMPTTAAADGFGDPRSAAMAQPMGASRCRSDFR